jgi:drug/metabolite transporter (DMT)-like permease
VTPETPGQRRRLHAGLAAGVLAVSWAAILVRLAAAPPLAVAAWRMGLAAIPAMAFAAWRRREELERLDRRARLWLAASGLALALHFATWIASLRLTTVASSVSLVTTQPIWAALLARALLGERVGRRAWAGIGLAVIGGSAVAGADFSARPEGLAGDALALAGGALAAVYLVAGRRSRAELSLGAYAGVVYPVAAAALLLAAAVSGAPLGGYAAGTWVALGLLALVPQLLGHSLLNWSLRWLSAPFVAVAILGEPVVSTLLAIPVLGETPGPLQAAGAALTIAGVAVAATGEAPRPSPPQM